MNKKCVNTQPTRSKCNRQSRIHRENCKQVNSSSKTRQDLCHKDWTFTGGQNIPAENDRFKDANGNPIKRYECKITHVNNGKEQKWTVSKTVCLQIIEQLRKEFYSAESDKTW